MEKNNVTLREIALSKMSEDEPPQSMSETFQGLQIDENLYQIRNIPAVIPGISFGDVFEPRSDRPGWRLVTRSRYSTILVGPKEHMNTVGGNTLIREQIQTIRSIPGVIQEQHGAMYCFAILPEHIDRVVDLLNEGGTRLWDWTVSSDRASK